MTMPTVTVRAKVQELKAIGREGVYSRYIELPRELKWSHMGKRESWDTLPAAQSFRNSDMFPRMVSGWVRRALNLSRDETLRLHLIRNGEAVELPACVSLDESGFLATVVITISDEHTARRAA